MRAVGKEQVGSLPVGKGERERENRRCALVAGGSGAGYFRKKKDNRRTGEITLADRKRYVAR